MTETMDSQLFPSPPALTGKNFTATAEQLQPFLVDCRRYLHQHPEVGFNEFNTAAFVRGILRGSGFEVHEAAETGSWLEIQGNKAGPTLAYRADLDALPMQDAKDAAYASKNKGVAHLCGHDAHTTIAMGVALLARHHKADLHGKLRVFFQPNEEGVPSGAPRMIAAGVLKDVTGVLGIHLDPTLNSGRFGLIKGPVTATSDWFDLQIVGQRSLHSARPHTGADCVWLATQIAQSLYGLAGRTTDARVPIILSICRFRAGEAYNVIPKIVEMGGSVRCSENNARKPFIEKMEAVAQQMAQIHGAEARFTWYEGSPAMFNDAHLVDVAGRCIENLHGAEAIHRIDKPSMGAEDFAYYQEQTAGAMIRVGSRGGPDSAHPLHSTLFDLDEDIMAPTSATMTQILFRLSKNRS
jgi:amidohydrolase